MPAPHAAPHTPSPAPCMCMDFVRHALERWEGTLVRYPDPSVDRLAQVVTERNGWAHWVLADDLPTTSYAWRLWSAFALLADHLQT